MLFANTRTRVEENTPEDTNEAIRARTAESVARCSTRGDEAIDRRLSELDREWDIERVLETNAAIVSLVGLGMGATVDRRWFFLPAVVAGFLLQHALQGWCPPLPVFRHLGIRTQAEIDAERYALKALRGDFDAVPVSAAADIQALAAVEAAQ